MQQHTVLHNALEECLRGNFTNLRQLNTSFSNILTAIDQHWATTTTSADHFYRETSKTKGRLQELVFKTGAFLKVPWFRATIGDNYTFYEDMERCTDFNYMSGWKSSANEWGADIILH